jgi:hypothetical protein
MYVFIYPFKILELWVGHVDLLNDIEYWIEKDADGSDRGQI